MAVLKRHLYLDRLIALNGTPDIKVITGVRRCGKSVLLEQFAEYLSETEPQSCLIRINLQDLEFEELLDFRKLHAYVLERYVPGVHNVLIIDEVQLCRDFEKAINSLHTKHLFDIYLTGSNAFLLSSDLATLFTGRTMEVKVFPFSFSEYRSFVCPQANLQESFDAFARQGGMPGSYAYREERQRLDYVADVFRTVLLRDLVAKYCIRNREELQRIAMFMMDNVSNLLSPENICRSLRAVKSTISQKTVSRYIDYLVRAFLFYEAKRFDVKGKKYLSSNPKYYLCDPAFRYAVNGTRNMDFGRVYENIVYLELLRRGYDVYVGKLYRAEIDFVATRGGEKCYIQVSDNISDSATFEREYSPLLKIGDAYPKLIIARTRHEPYDYEGIKIVDLAGWLADPQGSAASV